MRARLFAALLSLAIAGCSNKAAEIPTENIIEQHFLNRWWQIERNLFFNYDECFYAASSGGLYLMNDHETYYVSEWSYDESENVFTVWDGNEVQILFVNEDEWIINYSIVSSTITPCER